jgi:hypothetical protein
MSQDDGYWPLEDTVPMSAVFPVQATTQEPAPPER